MDSSLPTDHATTSNRQGTQPKDSRSNLRMMKAHQVCLQATTPSQMTCSEVTTEVPTTLTSRVRTTEPVLCRLTPGAQLIQVRNSTIGTTSEQLITPTYHAPPSQQPDELRQQTDIQDSRLSTVHAQRRPYMTTSSATQSGLQNSRC